MVVLLPGLLATAVVNALCVREKRTEFDKVVDALLHTFVVIAAYAIVVGKIPLELHATFEGNETTYSLETIRGPFIALLLISLAWSVVFAAVDNNDLVFRVLRLCHVTTRTARSTVWHDVFSSYGPKGYVQVVLEDGTSVLGYLRKYSETPAEASLFLEDAAWVGEDGKVIPVDGPGILLTKASGIASIMFVKAELADSADTKAHSATAGE